MAARLRRWSRCAAAALVAPAQARHQSFVAGTLSKDSRRNQRILVWVGQGCSCSVLRSYLASASIDQTCSLRPTQSCFCLLLGYSWKTSMQSSHFDPCWGVLTLHPSAFFPALAIPKAFEGRLQFSEWKMVQHTAVRCLSKFATARIRPCCSRTTAEKTAAAISQALHLLPFLHRTIDLNHSLLRCSPKAILRSDQPYQICFPRLYL